MKKYRSRPEFGTVEETEVVKQTRKVVHMLSPSGEILRYPGSDFFYVDGGARIFIGITRGKIAAPSQPAPEGKWQTWSD